MGQKVHPKGFRLGVYIDWDARWFARKSYGEQVLEDMFIREYLDKQLERAEISRIEIEKAGDNVRVIIHTAKPGAVIGKKGQEIESLRSGIAKIIKRSVEISVQEEKQPELNAAIVANNIAAQIEKRVGYKQAIKRAALACMKTGARGVKIRVAGRLGGAEIARDEWVRLGSVPLHTLRANIDYCLAEAQTTYGVIGVKVWISKG